ncbi:hypothetical protein [Streptomyces qinzhouensis]|uniref:Tat pathway signal sequence domain protein n=1 Tax=Streptomyces qinzhouensis TaxID=2599401 RepID=A0A5B8IEG4_9ACTN|nr:hypothetical protein [Streptomyces qinzhouensis]QDY76898.1 hypothetical protein FQU76_10590 [Streptomyces qinzhouensis]
MRAAAIALRTVGVAAVLAAAPAALVLAPAEPAAGSARQSVRAGIPAAAPMVPSLLTPEAGPDPAVLVEARGGTDTGIRTGGDGTGPVETAAEGPAAESAGPGTAHTVIGLVLAGVAAVVVVVRGTHRRRRAPENGGRPARH